MGARYTCGVSEQGPCAFYGVRSQERHHSNVSSLLCEKRPEQRGLSLAVGLHPPVLQDSPSGWTRALVVAGTRPDVTRTGAVAARVSFTGSRGAAAHAGAGRGGGTRFHF
jgi:hypothetical protein